MSDNPTYRGLPSDYYDMLNKLIMARYPPAKASVVVCHSEPGAWSPARYETSRCPPEGYTRKNAMRVVGRTMFETDRLDAEHVSRCNKMDEVWVGLVSHRCMWGCPFTSGGCQIRYMDRTGCHQLHRVLTHNTNVVKSARQTCRHRDS